MITHLKNSIEASLAIMKSEVKSTEKSITVDGKAMLFAEDFIYVDSPECSQKITLEKIKGIGVTYGHQDITFRFIGYDYKYVAAVIINASNPFKKDELNRHIQSRNKQKKDQL